MLGRCVSCCLVVLLLGQTSLAKPAKIKLLLKTDRPGAVIEYLSGSIPRLVGQPGQPFELDISDRKTGDTLQFVVRPENFGKNLQSFMPTRVTFSTVPDLIPREHQRWQRGIHLEDARFPVVFQVEPRGAGVYVPTAGGYSFLGRTYEVIELDRSAYLDENLDPRPVTLALGDAVKDGEIAKDIGPYYGYGPRKEWKADPWAVKARTVSTQDNRMAAFYPDPPEQLAPAPGGSAARAQLWVRRHPFQAVVLGVVAACGLILIPTVYLPRHRAKRALYDRLKKFDELRANVDINKDPLLGHTFDRWTTWKKLGAGGMAVVYWALPNHSADEDEAVALKVMNDEVAGDAEYQARFNREIKISSELNHPNIVSLIDWGEEEGRLFLVMEFIKGTTLREQIPAGGATLADTMSILRGLCAGLSHAHKLGVVHRDLKPDNVMINHNKQVKVMDLGLAKRDENKTAITKTGDTFGTPAYMAPEQIAGSGNPDPRTDQYAVGVMLFELLTGRRPFEEEDSLQMIMKHLQADPPSIREFKPELPEAAAEVVARMLAKDPSQRFPNMQAACGALEDALRPLLTVKP